MAPTEPAGARRGRSDRPLWQCPCCGALLVGRNIFRVDHLRPDAHIHWFRVTRPDDLDAGVRRLLCASYEVGAGAAPDQPLT